MRKISVSLPILLLAACSHTGENADKGGAAGVKSGNTDPRQAWCRNLKDSLDLYRQQNDTLQSRIEAVRSEFTALVSDFEIVTDPMLVEPYRVVRGWKGHDTTGRQGILARVLEDGSIEVVVTAAGDFSSVTLSSSGESVKSCTVPAGNALHTRTGGLTRVAFNEAAPLAAFVAGHISKPVTLTLSGGKSFTLNGAQKKMMADSWRFASLQKELNELERRESVIYNKMQLVRTKVDELQQTPVKENQTYR